MKILNTLCLLILMLPLQAQNLTQTVRGTVYDLDTQTPLIGAEVIILNSNPLKGTSSSFYGDFRFSDVPIGRINIGVQYLGYEEKVISNVVVNSGKEVVLNIYLQESILKLEEVVVKANTAKGEALNEMSIISTRSISPEQTNRYAGGFNDPSRIMSNFAGITSTQDGSNDIIVRGNSPKYMQWRLEGMQITNPNHFGDQSAVGGAVSALNNNLLTTSDFHTGAFTAEFGDVLSGVYDVKLRAGNNEKFEGVAGLGLLGTELTLEGPFKKGSGASYLFNYRFSTAGLISDLGLVDIEGGVPSFQDAAFKIVVPTHNMGTFSLFGLGGLSNFLFEDVKQDFWETPGDRSMLADIKEDYKKQSHLLNLGLNHSIALSDQSYLKTSLTYSNEGIEDQVFETKFIEILDPQNNVLEDSTVSRTLNFNGKINKGIWRAATTYHHKLSAKHKIQLGSKYALFQHKMNQSQLRGEGLSRFELLDINEDLSTLRNFVSWKFRINEELTLVSGLHNFNVLFNQQSTLEPRLAMQWKMNPSTSVNVGFGKHSTLESVHNYFAKVEGADGSITEPNRDLEVLKADHYVAGIEKRIGKQARLKVEAYYQNLYNLPVENLATSFYATINEGLEFRYIDLVNEGTGKNYGVEVTLEKFFSNNFYYLINASLFNSKYTAKDGIERNTTYNGNYLINILAGKEFEGWGKKQNQTFGINLKAFFGGGKKIIPLLRDANGALAVNPDAGEFFDYSKAYEVSLDDPYQIIVSFSYKWNKTKTTHELFLNLDNITNNKGRISEYYDEAQPGNVGHLTQFGIFPNLMYRIYF